MGLLSIFNKKDDGNILVAPCDGKLIDITDVNDDVFAQKMMGDGFAVIPKGNCIYSPCDGEISLVFKTKHAIGIKLKNGMKVLVHIGVDTVNLNGKGFEVYKSEKQKVKKGSLLVEFDEEILKGYDKSVITIITDNNSIAYDKHISNKDCKKGEGVIEVSHETVEKN